jgi:peptidoglycan/LPS O-acetylase OafA/YrhL
MAVSAPVAAEIHGAERDAYDAYRKQRYFPALDGVRAVAITLVFTVHVGYERFWRPFWGGNGVTLFFVLSGFLITTLALREEERNGRLSLKSFYIRRVFRIYPMYLGVLAFYCLVIYGAHFEPDRRGEFSNQLPYYLLGFPEHGFFSFHGGLHDAPPFSGAWSIGIEEKFYLVWPLVGFVLLMGKVNARLIVCAVAAVLFIAGPEITRDGIYVYQYLFIVLGVAVGLLLHQRRTFNRLRILGTDRVMVALFALFVASQFAIGLDRENRLLTTPDGLVLAALICGVAISNGNATAWLRSRPAVLIGRISYVFYLIHAFVLNTFEKTFLGSSDIVHSIAVALVAYPFAVGVSWVIHVLAEKPIIGIGHRLAHRRKPFHAV